MRGRDGIELFSRRWEAASPRAVCLLVHGLGEHSGRYEDLAQDLTRRGLSVWAMDHRGHGCSQGRRGDCRGLADFVEDLDRLVEELKGQKPALPRILIGHSLGGLIALAYAVRHPAAARALALSSPAFRLAQDPPPLKVGLAEALARLLPLTPIPNGLDPRYISRDPRVVEAYQRDPLVHRVLTARCAVALREAMTDSPKLAEGLKIPCLILQAGSDRICDPEAAERFSRAAKDSLVTFRRYEGLYHELFNEPERARVVEDLVRWIDGVLNEGSTGNV
ncbi:MAG: lysophospholipase [Candidatus Omnitrophica bacterium]|nr:lysophospholipase [Candidatus Omnitrophota bacterium]